MEVFLVRSTNSALAGNPIHGIFTDAKAAEEAKTAFESAEATHLQLRWDEDWEAFASAFYVEECPTDIPVAQLIAEKYDLEG